jgi:hypothetical protein
MLVEVLVSAVLLLILAMATLSIIDRAGTQAGSDRSRAVATSVAQADQDRLRGLKPSALYSYGTLSSTKTVDDVVYNITSEVDLARNTSATGGSTVCASSGTARADYFQLTSTVTWPNMGQTRPVKLATLLSPGVTDPTKGSITVKLLTESGAPVQGATVNTGSLSATTNSAGCVYFSNVAAGTYPVTWSKVGYVDKQGNGIGGQSVTVAANANAAISDNYDLAATIPVNLKTAAATPAATTWPTITLKSGSYQRTVSVTGSATSVSVPGLYPYAGGYQTYAGNCSGNQPDQTGYDSSFFSPEHPESAVVAAPGQSTGGITAYLRPLSVNVTSSTFGATTYNYKIVTNGPAACTDTYPAGNVWTSTASNVGTAATALIPWGKYKVCVRQTKGATTRYATATVDNVPSSTWTSNFTSPAASPTAVDVTSSSPTAVPTGC